MPKLKENQVPSYRLHKQSGQAVVTLNGKDVLLGRHGSAESKAEYRRLTAEWMASKGVPPSVTGADLTVSELILAYWRHAKTYYRRLDLYKLALRPLRQLYGHTRAADFGPRSLKAVVHEMTQLGWVRTSINKHAARIKSVFKWAVGNEMVPASVYHGLLAVSGLTRGRSDAKESEPVRPVPEDFVEAVLPHLSRQVRSMVELQLLTGARPGEICSMRGCDVDTSGTVWVYKPDSHKTQHLGHDRLIYLGPRARAIVEQYLQPNPLARLFSAAEAEAERRAVRHARRETPAGVGNVPGSNRSRRPKRPPGGCYTVASYRRAIARACERAFEMPVELLEPRSAKAVGAESKLPKGEQEQRRKDRAAKRRAWRAAHVWHPHQLRHNAATRLRKEYGLEAAQVILGHKSLSVTEIYAEKNVEAARRIMAEVG